MSSTRTLRDALHGPSGPMSDAALADHGLHDEVYQVYSRPAPTVAQKAALVARLHELLADEEGVAEVERAVREGRLRALLGRGFGWALPIFEAER